MFNTVTPPLINISARNLDSKRSKQDARIGVSRSANNNDRIMMKNNGITTNKTAEVNFCGLAGSKVEKLYTNPKLHKVLEFAANKQLVFDAAFALLLTCALRPASIMVLPSKKNQDDQKYAAAHSIASGVIGFAISNIVFTPISNAISKIKNKPTDYITDNALLSLDKGKTILNKTAKTYLDRIPDIVGSVPKGILTIALIPPILKYVFGWEKKKPEIKNAQPTQTEPSAKGGLK